MKSAKLLIISLFLSSLLSCYNFEFLGEGPIKNVNLGGWEHLQKGMTKKEVIQLIGDSHSKIGPRVLETKETQYKSLEYWEYGWSKGIQDMGSVSDKSYIIYFDQNEQLLSWKAPKTNP